VAEGVIRLVAPQQLIQIRPDIWQPADTVGWLNRPNVRAKINTGERTVNMFTDAEGFRVGAAGRVNANKKVLILGDSFMEALQVEYEQSGAGLLQDALPKLVGEPVAVRNAAVDGWDPDQYVMRARSLLARDHYDLVITGVYLRNDVISRDRGYLPPRPRDERYRLRFPRSLSFTELTNAILRPFNDYMEVRSHLYIFVRNRMQTLRMQVGLSPYSFPPQFLKSQADAPRWQVTSGLLAKVNELAKQHGVPALFVLIPAPFQVDSASMMRQIQGFHLDPNAIDLEQPNRILGEQLEAQGLDVYDILPEFREADQRGEQLYGSVDPHFSPEGNQLFATLVAPRAADLLRTGAEPPPPKP
jgi:SGNH hydrolase-like domain, acetyltransferase AlgX